MFKGASNNTIDAKGRLVIPQKFRDQLSESGFVITRGMDGCVWIYPKPRFDVMTEKLMKMQSTAVDTRKLSRFLLAFAEDGEFDSQGRIIISQPLREYAGLTKDVLTTGILDRIEIWDKTRWDEYSDNNLEGDDFNKAVIDFDF